MSVTLSACNSAHYHLHNIIVLFHHSIFYFLVLNVIILNIKSLVELMVLGKKIVTFVICSKGTVTAHIIWCVYWNKHFMTVIVKNTCIKVVTSCTPSLKGKDSILLRLFSVYVHCHTSTFKPDDQFLWNLVWPVWYLRPF